MTLPVFRRFSLEDIPDAPEWIEQVIVPLNLFCETTVSTLNKNLTVGQNVQGTIYTTSFFTPSDYNFNGMAPISFAYDGGGQPRVCLIGRLWKVNGTKILSPWQLVDWSLNINTSPFRVNIAHIAGLEAQTRYNVTFLVM